MTDPTISVDGVGKRYVKYDDTPTLIGKLARLRQTTRRSQLWALSNIDFEVDRGSCVGVIGRNGSGKTTLLRMLAGVTAPTVGRVTVRGRIAPLISVGVGFHHELSGRENVYLSGTILGLTRQEIDDRFDAIVDFAEVRDFIDTPVKFYSSGMYVRLGFAVSIFADPEVLLVDEVLAVGDLAFQLKCFDRMEEIRSSGATIVVVSHNLNAIRRLCDRTLVIHEGALRHAGDTAKGIALFHELLGEERDIDGSGGRRLGEVRGTGKAAFSSFTLTAPPGSELGHLSHGSTAHFVADVSTLQAVAAPVLRLSVFHESGVQVYGKAIQLADQEPGARSHVSIELPIRLPSGSYSAEIMLIGLDGSVHAVQPKAVLFYTRGREGVSGVADLDASIEVTTRRAQ